MFPDSNYAESLLQLSPGDLVIAYTDGIIEATNPAGEEWGVQGLLKATAAFRLRCAEDAESLVGLIFNCMDEFSRSCHRDDATLAILRVV